MKRGEMPEYEDLVKKISENYTSGQARAAKAVGHIFTNLFLLKMN